MTTLIIALLIAIALIIVLVVSTLRDRPSFPPSPAQDSSPSPELLDEFLPCPIQFVERIFSSRDADFVALSHSSELSRLFLEERRTLALFWVAQTSLGIRQIMHKHAEASRAASDLDLRTEFRLFARYVELRSLCFSLTFLLHLVGPQNLRSLAVRTGKLSRRIAASEQAFAIASARSSSGNAISR